MHFEKRKNYCPFLFNQRIIPILRFFDVFSIFSPPKHIAIAPNRWGMVSGYFSRHFLLLWKFSFLTILARLGPQNVPVGPKMAQNGHFWTIFGHFGGPKGGIPPLKVIACVPETLGGHPPRISPTSMWSGEAPWQTPGPLQGPRVGFYPI